MSDCARFLVGLALLAVIVFTLACMWRSRREWRSAASRQRIEDTARYYRMPI